MKRLTVALHWVVATAVLAQLALGWWMGTIAKSPPGPRAAWFNVHKSVGLSVSVLVLLWLASRAWGKPADALPRWQRIAARANHALLFAVMLALAASGYLGSSFTPYPVLYFGWKLPLWAAPWPAGKEAMSLFHLGAAWLLMSLLVVHVGAALWHWFHGHPAAHRIGLPRLRSP